MADSKYGHLFLKEPLIPSKHPESKAEVLQIGGEIAAEQWGGTPIHFVLHAVENPLTMGGDKGHTHPEAELILFIGPDPMNYRYFPAEAEFYIGEEMEKHIINKTTYLWIPPNLLHCPLIFTRVDEPITFGHIVFAPDYEVDRREQTSLPDRSEHVKLAMDRYETKKIECRVMETHPIKSWRTGTLENGIMPDLLPHVLSMAVPAVAVLTAGEVAEYPCHSSVHRIKKIIKQAAS